MPLVKIVTRDRFVISGYISKKYFPLPQLLAAGAAGTLGKSAGKSLGGAPVFRTGRINNLYIFQCIE
jgi:hypothetical protein